MKNDIITPITLFVIALILLLVPGEIINLAIRIIGLIIIVSGILFVKNNINKKENSYGIFMIILGLVFIFEPEVIAGIIPFMLGAWIIIKSINKLQYIYAFKGNKQYVKPLAINIIALVIGVVLIINPFRGAEAILRIVAIFLLIYSGLDIISYYMMKSKKVKVIK